VTVGRLLFCLVVTAALASLPGVACAWLKTTQETGPVVAVLTSSSAATIALSLGLVPTVYRPRYAHHHYREQSDAWCSISR
jgi:uncharacterized membrane protein